MQVDPKLARIVAGIVLVGATLAGFVDWTIKNSERLQAQSVTLEERIQRLEDMHPKIKGKKLVKKRKGILRTLGEIVW